MNNYRNMKYASISFFSLILMILIGFILYQKKTVQAIRNESISENRTISEVEEKNSESREDKNKNSQRMENHSQWNLILINASHPLSKDYTVNLKQISNEHSVDARIYEDLQAMMDNARLEGLSPLICSSYRSHEKQTLLFEQEIQNQMASGLTEDEAKIEAAKWVAVPGTSEHESGLAVDIVSADYQILDEKQMDTKEQQWLMENSWKYGFILRYPENKSNITGICFEPWHYRYVGKEAAREIMEQGLCLEEYLNTNKYFLCP